MLYIAIYTYLGIESIVEGGVLQDGDDVGIGVERDVRCEVGVRKVCRDCLGITEATLEASEVVLESANEVSLIIDGVSARGEARCRPVPEALLVLAKSLDLYSKESDFKNI